MTIQKRYLHLPVQESTPEQSVTLLLDGLPERTFRIKLAQGTPDWWAFLEIGAWKGKRLELTVEEGVVPPLVQADTLPDAESLYREPLRPRLHFSSRRGWLNDPNGLVFYQGEYHLFYQHNPYGWGWGNMHWGHATSTDLVHWQEHGDVLAPDPLGAMFSGSAVVDGDNTSGFGREGVPPLVLVYTAAGNPTTQCLAYSTDGRTFTKYEGNPVLPQITDGNRDPKVFWHAPTQRWVMVLYVGMPENLHTVHFFTSPNLRAWTLASMVEGSKGGDNFLYECPDCFALPLDNNPDDLRWVLTAANSRYSIGSFDGTTFTPEHHNLPDVWGKGFYAAQTFSDTAERVQLGWIQAPSPGMPFNQLQSLPCILELKTTTQGPRLVRTPISALASLRQGGNQAAQWATFQAEQLELRASWTKEGSAPVTFQLRGIAITVLPESEELVVEGHRAPAPWVEGRQNVIVYVDRTVIEVFASDGQTYLTLPVLPDPENQRVEIEGAVPDGWELYALSSLWERAEATATAPSSPDQERPSAQD